MTSRATPLAVKVSTLLCERKERREGMIRVGTDTWAPHFFPLSPHVYFNLHNDWAAIWIRALPSTYEIAEGVILNGFNS